MPARIQYFIPHVMSQSKSQIAISETLTEHLGYQPISVVDDIINVVNEIMYRCTDQIENALLERRSDLIERNKKQAEAEKKNDDDDVMVNEGSPYKNAVRYSEDDIRKGTAKLESLLEHLINWNYDKLELYIIRNILTIPDDLLAGGYVRLKHQEGMKIVPDTIDKAAKLDKQYADKMAEISRQIEENKKISDMIVKLTKMDKKVTLLKKKVAPMDYKGVLKSRSSTNASRTGKNIVQKNTLGSKLVEKYDLKPLKETCLFINSEIRRGYKLLEGAKPFLEDETIVKTAEHSAKEDNFVDEQVRDMFTSEKTKKPTGFAIQEGDVTESLLDKVGKLVPK